MNNISFGPTNLANVVTPFNPLGRQVVGLENAESKEQVFTPVEETEAAAPGRNQENGNPLDRNEQRRQRINDRREQQQLQSEQQLIRELAARDREVRNHEAAHSAVGGQYVRGTTYTYQRGPNGVSYAVGGEVQIVLPATSDPQQLLKAAEQVRRAALAPAEPSAQDRRVAASAALLAQQARADIAAEQRAERDRADGNAATEGTDGTEAVERPVSPESASAGGQRDQQEEKNPPFEVARFNEATSRILGLEDDRLIGSILDQRA